VVGEVLTANNASGSLATFPNDLAWVIQCRYSSPWPKRPVQQISPCCASHSDAWGHVHGPRFTISLKRSTLIFRYPQAGRPITPSIGVKLAEICSLQGFSFWPNSDMRRRSLLRCTETVRPAIV